MLPAGEPESVRRQVSADSWQAAFEKSARATGEACRVHLDLMQPGPCAAQRVQDWEVTSIASIHIRTALIIAWQALLAGCLTAVHTTVLFYHINQCSVPPYRTSLMRSGEQWPGPPEPLRPSTAALRDRPSPRGCMRQCWRQRLEPGRRWVQVDLIGLQRHA